jgi:hypothetical protein
MGCPICNDEHIPRDVSVIERRGKRVAVQGKVYAIIPRNNTYSPFRNFFTVSLYPRRGRVKYIKFKTQRELVRWPFKVKNNFVVNGCLHIVDGKELIFNITQVEQAQK